MPKHKSFSGNKLFLIYFFIKGFGFVRKMNKKMFIQKIPSMDKDMNKVREGF
jgi:hypothetical protein